MPIGTLKIGVLGGLVPGGTETFNAPGTFSIPPGVRKVSITGRGGSGNPGNAGNAGTAGNPGTGGAGGPGGVGGNIPQMPRPACCEIRGGIAYKTTVSPNPPGQAFAFGPGVPLNNPSNIFTRSVRGSPGCSGISGNAGSAGNTGNPGNSGQSSSGLGNTFPGGAGGNAGVAGAAGNGGTGGTGGGKGNQSVGPFNCNTPGGAGGAGGNGGGSGGRGPLSLTQEGFPFPPVNFPGGIFALGGQGGGGAGVVNDGQSGQVGVYASGGNPSFVPRQSSPFGGSGGCANAPVTGPGIPPVTPVPSVPTSTTGGFGGSPFFPATTSGGRSIILTPISDGPGGSVANPNPCYSRLAAPSYNPSSVNSAAFLSLFRSGGGGAVGLSGSFPPTFLAGGGGGGGGRGNAGNAGGGSSTPTGAAGTPQTFNCVPVTPGGTEPITVSSPGGQIVISWNPQ